MRVPEASTAVGAGDLQAQHWLDNSSPSGGGLTSKSWKSPTEIAGSGAISKINLSRLAVKGEPGSSSTSSLRLPIMAGSTSMAPRTPTTHEAARRSERAPAGSFCWRHHTAPSIREEEARHASMRAPAVALQ